MRELVERVTCDMCGDYSIEEVTAEGLTVEEVAFTWDNIVFKMDVCVLKCKGKMVTWSIASLVEKARATPPAKKKAPAKPKAHRPKGQGLYAAFQQDDGTYSCPAKGCDLNTKSGAGIGKHFEHTPAHRPRKMAAVS